MPKLSLKLENETKELELAGGISLMEALRSQGLYPGEAPCGGKGICGRCLMEVSGQLSPPSPAELALLSPGETRRLACMAVIEGDCSVTVKASGQKTAVESSTTAYRPDLGLCGLGAAVDIGTTTVVLYLYQLESGECLAVISDANAQRSFGADVISRIQYTMENPAGLSTLRDRIRCQLNELLSQALSQAGRTGQELLRLSIAGNTVMLHLLAGLDPASIATAPFTPKSLFGEYYTAQSLGLDAAPNAQAYLIPCLSGYVGGDISAGLTAVRAAAAQEPILFLDLGTNGEMALGDEKGLLCCATAAGPAFEGGCISCGMSALPGAVDKVWLDNGKLSFSVIGDLEASGLCGSGLLDLVAVLLELGVIDETGRLLPPEEAPEDYAGYISQTQGGTAFHLTPGLRLTGKDVRQLQLAKAAVAAGIETLLAHAGLEASAISRVYLAGGFGAWLRPESAAKLGLFPYGLLPKVQAVGNSAGAGASDILLSSKARLALEETVEKCRYMELSLCADFNERFIDCMAFE